MDGMQWPMLLPGFATLLIWIGTIYWVNKDAERRGKSGCLAALFVAFVFWPFSLLIWLLFRPETRTQEIPRHDR